MKIIDVPPAIIHLLGMANKDSIAAWGQPQSLDHPLPPVKPLTQAMLPAELWPWVSDIAYRVQCPIDYVAAVALVMLGSVIGAGCAIRPKQKDNWMEIPNVWGAVVGPPGSKKSPAVTQVMAPLFQLDRDAQQQYGTARLQYTIDLDHYKSALDQYKKQIKGQQGQASSHPGPAPTEPVCKRHYTNDCTFEALSCILEGNPRGCLVSHDELTSLLAGFERPGREGERQGYLTAWNGLQGHRVDRVGRGAIYIPRLAVSVLGGIQPDKLEEFLSNTQNSFGNDGFMQRLQLMVYPDPIAITSVVDETPDHQARKVVFDIVDHLATRIETLQPRQDQSDDIPYFRFAESVQPAFNHWLLTNEQRVPTEDSPLMAEHLAKFKKLVPALALIDHLVGMASGRIPRGQSVKADSLQRAIAYADYLETHARRVYGLSANRKCRAAILLGKKLQKGQLQNGFSTREIERKGWSGLTDAGDIKAACGELELANWIRRNEQARERVSGRPPNPTYSINPAVVTPINAGGKTTKPTKRKAKSSP